MQKTDGRSELLIWILNPSYGLDLKSSESLEKMISAARSEHEID